MSEQTIPVLVRPAALAAEETSKAVPEEKGPLENKEASFILTDPVELLVYAMLEEVSPRVVRNVIAKVEGMIKLPHTEQDRIHNEGFFMTHQMERSMAKALAKKLSSVMVGRTHVEEKLRQKIRHQRKELRRLNAQNITMMWRLHFELGAHKGEFAYGLPWASKKQREFGAKIKDVLHWIPRTEGVHSNSKTDAWLKVEGALRAMIDLIPPKEDA